MSRFDHRFFPSLGVLHEMFICDAEKGLLYHNPDKPHWYFASDAYQERWIRQWADKVAGCKNKSDGYIYVSTNYGLRPVHRIIYAMHHALEPIQQPDEIDHEDGIHDHNWISNLRGASSSNNRHNSVMHKRNTSGLKGIYPKAGGWRAMICLNYVKQEKWFKNKEDAIVWRESMRKSLHKEFEYAGGKR